MTIRRDPLSRHGATQRAIEEVGGFDAAAEITGRKAKFLYGATNPTAEGRHAVDLSLRDVCNLTRAGAQAFIDLLVQLGGAQVIAVPAAAPGGTLLGAIARLGVESGQAMTVASAALEDGVVTPNERVAMRKEILEVQQVLTTLLRHLDD